MSGKSSDGAQGPVRHASMLDVLRLRSASNGSRSASISSLQSHGQRTQSNISKILQRRPTVGHSIGHKTQPHRGDFWKKLLHDNNAKKLRKLKIKRKIRIAIRLSLFLRHWWLKHLKSVENMVLSDEKLDFFTKLLKPQAKEEKPSDILFDVSEYKANKHQKISQEARRILTILPQYRTDSEVHYVRIALRSHKEIVNCPMRMQTLIAKYGMLECFGAKRCIVKQDHPPQAFYYILYGTVAVALDDGTEKRVVRLLERGESFGELSIVNNEMRQSSVISKTDVELISIKKEVYEDAFMSGGYKKITDPDHEQFIRSLDFLNGWPTNLLEINPNLFIFIYFPRGTVIVKDSHYCEWLYVIKSGSVDVLKKLVKSKPTVNEKTGKQRKMPRPEREGLEAFICGSYFQYCEDNNIALPEPVSIDDHEEGRAQQEPKPSLLGRRRRSLSAPPIRTDKWTALAQKTNTISHGHKLSNSESKLRWWKYFRSVRPKISLAQVIKKHVKVDEEVSDNFCAPSEEVTSPLHEKRTYLDDLNKGVKKRAHLLTEADINPQFVKVQTLTKGCTFGLADLVLGEQPNMCLVSNGAECLMLKKDFYEEHCPQSLLRKLLQIVGPYPEDESMQRDLAIKLNWNAQKKAIINGTMSDIQQRLSRVNS